MSDILIKPLKLGNDTFFDIEQGKEIFKMGYEATIEKAKSIVKLL